MTQKELSQLICTLTTLSNKADNWDRLIEYFETNEDIDKYFPELKNDYKEKELYFGKANIIMKLIQKLLYMNKSKE